MIARYFKHTLTRVCFIILLLRRGKDSRERTPGKGFPEKDSQERILRYNDLCFLFSHAIIDSETRDRRLLPGRCMYGQQQKQIAEALPLFVHQY